MRFAIPFSRTTLSAYISFILHWGYDSDIVREAGIDFANRAQEVQDGNQS